MSTYRERREARAERLRGWAEKREQDATAAITQIHDTYSGDYAFNTQPGHIPERSRVIARQERAFESLHKAESMSSRAAGIEAQLAGAIYSDDPDAIEAFEARIADLEAERDRIKAYNASCRKGARNVDLLDEHQQAELVSLARVAAFQIGKHGEFPAYVLSNLAGNINRNKKRLAALQA